MYYNEASFRTEIYIIIACGVVWAWIFENSEKLDTQIDFTIAFSIPSLLLIVGFTRYIALKFRIERLAFYIYCIERKYFADDAATGGWEHFVGKTRENEFVGYYDKVTDSFNWKGQAKKFGDPDFKFKWALFTRSATWTWRTLILLNFSTVIYLTKVYEPLLSAI